MLNRWRSPTLSRHSLLLANGSTKLTGCCVERLAFGCSFLTPVLAKPSVLNSQPSTGFSTDSNRSSMPKPPSIHSISKRSMQR